MLWEGNRGRNYPLDYNSLRLRKNHEIYYVIRYTFLVSENTLLSARTPLVLLMSASFSQKSTFFGKKYLPQKQEQESCVKDFLVEFSIFVR